MFLKKLRFDGRDKEYKGEKAVVGNRLGDIGTAIQEYAESKGYGVVRDLVGHSVGPTCMKNQWYRIMVVLDAVFNTWRMVLIEPVNTGSGRLIQIWKLVGPRRWPFLSIRASICDYKKMVQYLD